VTGWRAPLTHGAQTQHGFELVLALRGCGSLRGLLTGGCDDISATVVDGGLREVLGLVLHDEDCINNAQQHQKEEGGCPHGSSPQSQSQRWRGSDVR
jgi:hypothetical protein